MYPTGLRGDPRVPRIRRAYLTFVFLRDPGRARRDGRDRLGWVGGVRDFVWQRARFARGGRRRCLRPYRPLLTHHGRRGRFAILDRGLRLGRRGARAGSAVRGCALVGIFRGDVVLAGGGGARAPDLGHTVLNWALRYVEASIVSGTILAEPAVSALLAWLILSERPGLATLLGGAVVLAGLFLLLRGYRASHERSKLPAEPVA